METKRRTKIVCTIGPVTASAEMLEQLILGGMDVARLNFSHGDHESHRRTINLLRGISKRWGREVAILQDLAGPKIRLGVLPEEITLLPGQTIYLTADNSCPLGSDCLPVNYEYLYEDVEVGNRILLADGLVELAVQSKKINRLKCTVVAGGKLSSHKGVNLPTSLLRIASFTDKDRRDLAFGLEQGIDFVAMSFVRHEDDLSPLREMISASVQKPMLIAKIEKPQAVERLEQILGVVDGVMVARGDLGVEMPLEQVPVTQKHIIEKTRQAGKPVITATQMLGSMVVNPRPTRAEATDVANAILDGTDAVMLSDETAAGQHPLEAVQMLDRIAKATEGELKSGHFIKESVSPLLPSTSAAISHAVCWLAEDLKASAIVAFTTSGGTARLISRYRPFNDLVALTPSLQTCRQLNLSWGVTPIMSQSFDNTEVMFSAVEEWARNQGMGHNHECMVVTAGYPLNEAGRTNLIKILEMEDLLP